MLKSEVIKRPTVLVIPSNMAITSSPIILPHSLYKEAVYRGSPQRQSIEAVHKAQLPDCLTALLILAGIVMPFHRPHGTFTHPLIDYLLSVTT